MTDKELVERIRELTVQIKEGSDELATLYGTLWHRLGDAEDGPNA